MLPSSPMNQCKLHFMLIGLQNLRTIKTLGFFFNLLVNVCTHTDNKTLFNSLLQKNRCAHQSTSPRLPFGVFKNNNTQQCWVGYNQRATTWLWDLRQKILKYMKSQNIKFSNKRGTKFFYFMHCFIPISKLLADLNNKPMHSSLFITTDSFYYLLPLHGSHVLKYYCLQNYIN